MAATQDADHLFFPYLLEKYMPTNENVLAEWKAREAVVRASLAAPGVATVEQMKACSGMEFSAPRTQPVHCS